MAPLCWGWGGAGSGPAAMVLAGGAGSGPAAMVLACDGPAEVEGMTVPVLTLPVLFAGAPTPGATCGVGACTFGGAGGLKTPPTAERALVVALPTAVPTALVARETPLEIALPAPRTPLLNVVPTAPRLNAAFFWLISARSAPMADAIRTIPSSYPSGTSLPWRARGAPCTMGCPPGEPVNPSPPSSALPAIRMNGMRVCSDDLRIVRERAASSASNSWLSR